MLGHAPLPRTFEACLRDLDDASAKVRTSAVGDLARHVDDARDAVIERLARALADASPSVRAAAALALADVDAREATASLLASVEDDDPLVRQMAITALGEIGDPRATEKLRRATRDARPEVRFQAVVAYARVAPDDAEEALIAASRDDDASIRHIAVRAAEELVGGGARAASPALLDRFAAMLDDPERRVRLVAAVALGRAGDARGRETLLETVRAGAKSLDPEDVAAAIELSGALGLREALPALARRAFGLSRFGRDAFPHQARVALARLGDARARAAIVRDLDAFSVDKRTIAVASAAEGGVVEALPTLVAMRDRGGRVDVETLDEAIRELGGAKLDEVSP